MKRALILLVLVVTVAWLAQGSSANDTRQPAAASDPLNAAAPNAPLTPQGACCLNAGDTDPHWECFEGACYQVSGCGPNVNCSTCGCNPDDEWACINYGGYWDSYSCTCDYGCDPDGSQQRSCVAGGGTWDSYYCTCDYGCDPTGSQRQACLNAGRQWDDINCICSDTDVCVCDEEELVGYDSYDFEYCDGYYYQYCTDTYYDYYQYCDGTCGPRYWTEEVMSCYSYGEYCGDGGGGGGGGDCWSTGDCWCDDWWGICCEWDYCYEEEEFAY
jgi:hypothetical protein